MRILVDMDDTIEQLLQAWLDGLNRQYGRNVAYDDIMDWDLTKAYPGLSFQEVYGVPLQPGFWKTVKPIPGAAEGLKKLMDDGHEVFIVTATPYQSVQEKMGDLLFHYFPFLKWDQLIITFRKQMIKGDVMIDDGVHNLEGGDYVKILMSAPHNLSYDAEANGMIRVRNWTEILDVIEKLDHHG